MLKLIFNGANGRMGRALVPLLQQDPTINLVATTGKTDDLTETIKQTNADCVLDFTIPSTAYANAEIIINNNVHPIIGTSGLSADEVSALQQACALKQLGGLIVPNFAISAILMQDFAAKAAKWFTHAHITERHHRQKLDSPSGTAIATANKITQINPKLAKPTSEYGIEIESQRLDGIFAEQEILFNNNNESLRIEQKATSRACMHAGVLLACEQVVQLKHLEIGLEQFLL